MIVQFSHSSEDIELSEQLRMMELNVVFELVDIEEMIENTARVIFDDTVKLCYTYLIGTQLTSPLLPPIIL